MSDFDTMLWRQLRSGNEYEALFPKSLCKSTFVGNGNTDFSITEMEKVINQYAFQTEKVAKKLQRTSLKATTDTIHYFLFNHFQYLADQSNQLLRSPACSWFTRKKGIDCKSYSILASCILTNLEITHYIRKIKQPGYAPEEYTHVYVIVPKDQQTGNLESGYYVIDGTLKSNIEPAFIGKSDLQMSLQHYALNGTFENESINHGLGLSIGSFKLESIKDFENIIKSIDCIGGSSYSKGNIKKIHAAMETYFNALIARINQAVVNDNDDEFSKTVNEFFAITDLGLRASQKKLTEGWNSCSSKGISAVIKGWDFYKNIVGKALQAWIADGFVVVFATPQTFTFNSTDLYKTYGMGATSTNLTVSRQVIWYQPKGTPIKQFEITPYVADSNTSSFNPVSFLQSLGNVIADYVPDNNNPLNPNLQNGGGYVKNLNPDGSPKPKTMGAGTVVGVIIVLGGLTYALTQGAKK